MTITITLPSDTHSPNDTGHTTDHNTIVDALSTLGTNAANTNGDTFTGLTTFDAGTKFTSASPATPGSNTYTQYATANGQPQVITHSGHTGVVPTFQVGTTKITKTNPTVAADISDTFTIEANDANVGTTYMIELFFTGLWEASGNFNLEFDLDGTITNLVPIAAGVITAAHNYGGVFRLYLQILTTGSGGTFNIWSDGSISDTSVGARTASTGAVLHGNLTAQSINTTVSHTLAVAASFSSSNASQTIIGQGSTFRRSCN